MNVMEDMLSKAADGTLSNEELVIGLQTVWATLDSQGSTIQQLQEHLGQAQNELNLLRPIGAILGSRALLERVEHEMRVMTGGELYDTL